MSLADTERKLASLEDRIGASLGYRETTVKIGNTLVTPTPKVVNANQKAYSDDQLKGYTIRLGTSQSAKSLGNTITLFTVKVSREFPERILKSNNHWYLTRGTYKATCLLLDFKITPSRFIATIGVLKVNE